jgi:cyanophycinase
VRPSLRGSSHAGCVAILLSTTTQLDAQEIAAKPQIEVDAQQAGLLPSRGSLMLCGGSTLPDSILREFYRKGRESNGNLVIIPTASPRADSVETTRWTSMWQPYAWKQVSVVHVSDRSQANDPAVVSLLREADAVWLSGGDQSRLIECYLGTSVQSELTNLLKRDCIVGGTSAGAAVASKWMIAGGVTRPKMMEGFGLLPKFILDQHFSQRARFERLLQAMKAYPDQIGIGLDESTAVLIDRNAIEVFGEGAAYLFMPNTMAVDVPRGNVDGLGSTRVVAGEKIRL